MHNLQVIYAGVSVGLGPRLGLHVCAGSGAIVNCDEVNSRSTSTEQQAQMILNSVQLQKVILFVCHEWIKETVQFHSNWMVL